MLMYTVLGLEIFSHRLQFDENNHPVSEGGLVPSWNFDNFWDASLVVFVLLANDGWTVIYFDIYRSCGWLESSLYFFTLILLGQYVLL